MSSAQEDYTQLDDLEVVRRIEMAKAKLGKELVILGHHYVSDEVIQFADYRGDSLQLSRQAAASVDARYIVFCGVHFMAETAAILSRPGQIVVFPNLRAGCQMADMAEPDDVQEAWDQLTGIWDESDLIPITYVNSAASLKAFCGRHGGIVCTSSNAAKICQWALERANHILFFPDENLGTNTALGMGVPTDRIKVWNPSRPRGGNDESLSQATFVVWRGFCYVHHRFTVEHVAAVRAKYGGIQVVVHPECLPEVVALSDAVGSTSFIIKYAQEAPSGARMAIGTESNLVYRLAKEHADKLIVPLAESFCVSMARNNMRNLLQSLDSILDGHPREVVDVAPEIKEPARIAVERMLRES